KCPRQIGKVPTIASKRSTEFRAPALTLRAREGAFNNRRPREFSEAQMNDHKITSMYEVLGALEETLKAADPDKRKKLAQTLDAYHDDFPEDFLWATGAQSPILLYHLIMAIDTGCRPEKQSKPRGVVRLVDRRPESGREH